MNSGCRAGAACSVLFLTALLASGPLTQAEAAEPLATYSFGAGWATFGLPLPAGKAFTGLVVGSLQTQTDVKVRYPDGSIRFAVVTARIPSAGSYPITEGPAAVGSVTVPLPTASVEISVGGVTYVAQLPANTPPSWLTGPLVREVRAVQSFQGATGAAASLRATFDVRSYAGGGHRVDVTIGNTLNVSTAREVAYGVVMKVNGAALFTRANSITAGPSPLSSIDPATNAYTSRNHGLAVGDTIRLTSGTAAGMLRAVTRVVSADQVVLSYPVEVPLPVTWERLLFVQPYMTRWRKTLVTGGLVEAPVTPDFKPFQLAGALPAYMSLVADPIPSTTGPKFDPFRLGDLTFPLNAPGGRPEIGLYPAWLASYTVHKRPEQRAYLLAMGTNVAGAVSLHIDESDGTLLTLDRHPDFMLRRPDSSGDTGPAGGGASLLSVLYAAEVGSAHTPALSYPPYLITGDRFYLDEMKYWANASMLSWDWLRGSAAGLLTSQQVRAIAWGIRDIADVAAYAPDGDPQKAYFLTKLSNNIADLDRMAAAEPDALGGSLFGNPASGLQQIFMQGFAAWAFDHVGKQGFQPPRYLERVVRYWNNLYNAHPGFDRRYVISYQTSIVNATSGASFSSYADLFDYNYNRRPVDPWKNYAPPPQANGYSYNVTAHVLLSLAIQMGLPNATANFNYIFNATEGDATTKSDLKVLAQYAIGSDTGAWLTAPRGLHIVR